MVWFTCGWFIVISAQLAALTARINQLPPSVDPTLSPAPPPAQPAAQGMSAAAAVAPGGPMFDIYPMDPITAASIAPVSAPPS